jgi:hypothetical protein
MKSISPEELVYVPCLVGIPDHPRGHGYRLERRTQLDMSRRLSNIAGRSPTH